MKIDWWHMKISANEQDKKFLLYIWYNTDLLIKLTNYILYHLEKATIKDI